eukprot:1319474-Alexandrium_andersonii.AAC.1
MDYCFRTEDTSDETFDGPGDQGPRFARDPSAPGVAQRPSAWRYGRPGRRQRPEARAPSSDLADDRQWACAVGLAMG